ncbi:MAG: fumarylacetoacetate hydrolase family protein [Candidatus Sumerlaeaceae bacterium]|nr:fumarylacetoacetate hydrolase family protein [Candidatus Sumerlaeaceae bacterium]
MKLFRYSEAGRPQLAVEWRGIVVNAAAAMRAAGALVPQAIESADTAALAASDGSQLSALAAALDSVGATLPVVDLAAVEILPPVASPRQFICIGMNYRDHALEQGRPVPDHPIIFAKLPGALNAHDHPIVRPRTTAHLDYEAELGVIIGRGGRRIPRDRALEHVFGYTVVNDVSARDLQKADGQFVRAKSQDGFGPVGPCLVTADEIPDPQTLPICARVNGVTLQESNTREMIFGVAELVAFISEGITLTPGDLIATGTPAGVGAFRTPPVWLKAGDIVEIEIGGIGVLRNPVVEET